jgi:hypothetical protein
VNKRRLILLVGSVIALLVLVSFLVYLEPFAQRYQGRTVNQWLDFYAVKDKGPDKEVVQAFGTNALPALTLGVKVPFWRGKAVDTCVLFDQLLNVSFAERLSDKVVARTLHRMSIAHDWGCQLFARRMSGHGPIIRNLLATNPDDEFILQAVRFLEAASNRNELLSAFNDPNKNIRTRAIKLFKQYNHWDDATFQRWLASQTNGIATNVYGSTPNLKL